MIGWWHRTQFPYFKPLYFCNAIKIKKNIWNFLGTLNIQYSGSIRGRSYEISWVPPKAANTTAGKYQFEFQNHILFFKYIRPLIWHRNGSVFKIYKWISVLRRKKTVCNFVAWFISYTAFLMKEENSGGFFKHPVATITLSWVLLANYHNVLGVSARNCTALMLTI